MKTVAWSAGIFLVFALIGAGIVLRPDMLLPQKLEQGQVSFHAAYGLEDACARERLSHVAAAVAAMPGDGWSVHHRVEFGHNAFAFGVSQAMIGGVGTLLGMPEAPLTFNRSHLPISSQVISFRAQKFCEDRLIVADGPATALTFSVTHEIAHSVQDTLVEKNQGALPDWLREGHADALAVAGLRLPQNRCDLLSRVLAVTPGATRGKLLVLATVRPGESPMAILADGTGWPAGILMARLMVQALAEDGSLDLARLLMAAVSPADALDTVLRACRG